MKKKHLWIILIIFALIVCIVVALILIFSQREVEPEAHIHSYITETVASTCTEEGYTKYTCIDGDDEYCGDFLPPNGHHYEDYICIVCGEKQPLNIFSVVYSENSLIVSVSGTVAFSSFILVLSYDAEAMTITGYSETKPYSSTVNDVGGTVYIVYTSLSLHEEEGNIIEFFVNAKQSCTVELAIEQIIVVKEDLSMIEVWGDTVNGTVIVE